MRGKKPVCAVCGQGGFWVGYSLDFGEYRCANHIDTPGRQELDPPALPPRDGDQEWM